MDHSNKKRNTVCEIICVCMGMMLVISALASFIAAFVVWIMALVDGKNMDISDICPNNMLWEWLLVWGIITFINVGHSRKQTKETDTGVSLNICVSIILMAGNIALCWWGRREFDRDNKCIESHYGDTTFYKASAVFWWFYFVTITLVVGIIGTVIVGALMYLIITSCKCGRICMNKLCNIKQNTTDNKASLILEGTQEFDFQDPIPHTNNESANMFSV